MRTRIAVNIATEDEEMIQAATRSDNLILVPNLSAAQLIVQAQERLGLADVDSGYKSFDFIRDEAGKAYEVMVWHRPGLTVTTDEVRKYFADGFAGNTAAFLAWVMQERPVGWYASIPEDERLFKYGGELYAPCFCHGADLGLRFVGGGWAGSFSFVGFREVAQH